MPSRSQLLRTVELLAEKVNIPSLERATKRAAAPTYRPTR